MHLQRYLGAGYSSIPTIGTLFLLNAIAAGLIGFGLVAPIAAVLSGRRADLVVGLLATTGALIALSSLIALFISENGTLFGFHEPASGGAAVVAAIAAEIAAVLTTVPLAALCIGRAVSRRGEPMKLIGRYMGTLLVGLFLATFAIGGCGSSKTSSNGGSKAGAPASGSSSEPSGSSGGSSSGIPQKNGGDQDSDNNGAESDGDGNL